MRLRHSRSIFCFCFFIHVTLAYSKNDSPVKNGQRTNPKKHNPANVENSGVATLRHSSKFPHLDQIRTRIAGLDSDRRFSDRSNNSDARWGFGDSVRLRHHDWSNRVRVTTTTTITTPSPDDDLFNNYGELDRDEMHEIYDNIRIIFKGINECMGGGKEALELDRQMCIMEDHLEGDLIYSPADAGFVLQCILLAW
ncbi:hypothetical protein HUJ04_005279 [Dendroctonus ponderosae]|nr:hypothetical protein HUJ04_005279 [Dendroctonus ponderosae]